MTRRQKEPRVEPGARKRMRDFVFRHLHVLNYSARDVLALRYAMIDFPQLSWEQIASLTGGHFESVQYAHDKALEIIVRNTTETDIPELAQDPYADWAVIKETARRKAHAAIRSGKLVRQPCAKCGEARVEAHHPNYLHPLRIVWLCKKCHTEAHWKKAA